MKIGIVTFFYTNNYGGVLQALSLQEYLLSLGYDVEFINFNPKNVETKSFIRVKLSKLKHKIFNFNMISKNKIFDEVFVDFQSKYFKLSEKCNTYNHVEKIVTGYDCIIAGSDQIWNTRFVKSNLNYFLLEFTKNTNIITISYAACIGQMEQEEELLKHFASNLPKINYISVRNDFTKDFIESYKISKSVKKVLDPTFLVNLDSYIEPYSLKSSKKFILVYCLNETLADLLTSVLENINQYNDYDVILLHSKYKIKVNKKCIEIYDATPNQWLWFFKYASIVVTDSFHGMAFSIKNNKIFLVLHDNGLRSFRVKDLAEQFCLTDVCIFSKSQISTAKNFVFDYIKINKTLESNKEESKAFLNDALRIKK